MRTERGFTLIELVVVIVILGILAATAAPKFIDLSTDARIATLQAMEGALKSGAQMIHSKAIIHNKLTGNDRLDVNDISIRINSGYPIAIWNSSIRYVVNMDDISRTRRAATICEEEWCGRNARSIPSGITITAPGRVTKIYLKGYSYQDECGVYYINRADGSEPEYGVETTDC